MKKRFVSCMITMVLAISIAVSAFATENLNLKVFHGEDDITVFPSTDGDVTISVDSMGKVQKAQSWLTIPLFIFSQW